VSCLTFSNDGTHVLSKSHNNTCHEFGLRTSRILKESRGHASYINSGYYFLVDGTNALRYLTGSADGTVHVWDTSSELLHVLQPVSLGRDMPTAETSILMDHQTDSLSDGGSPNVHTVLLLHTPCQCMITVPRASHTFLSDYSSCVVHIFNVD
jgi:WD40 repeat protein